MGQKALLIRRIVLTALMAALIFVLTRMIQIPTPGNGYIHLGDAGIVFVSLAFGPWVGAVAGGLGTTLADLTSYPQWAVFSLLVHGLQGALIGLLVRRGVNKRTLTFAGIASVLVVVIGYFLAGWILMGLASTVKDIPLNIVQGLSGIVGGVLLYIGVTRAYPRLLHTAGRAS